MPVSREDFEILQSFALGKVLRTQPDGSPLSRLVHDANSDLRNLLGEAPGQSYEEALPSTEANIAAAMRDPNLTPRQQHEVWTNFKRIEGWTFGPTLDIRTKQHPNLVAYSDLPEEQRWKDELFLNLVRLHGEGSVVSPSLPALRVASWLSLIRHLGDCPEGTESDCTCGLMRIVRERAEHSRTGRPDTVREYLWPIDFGWLTAHADGMDEMRKSIEHAKRLAASMPALLDKSE